MYNIKIKGNNEPLSLNDQDGEIVDKAYEKWNTTKVDTYLKLTSWRGNASSIGNIQIEKTSKMVDGVDPRIAEQMRKDRIHDQQMLKLSPEGRFEAYTRGYFCFLTYGINGVYPKAEDFPKIEEKYKFLIDWFEQNPKRLIPESYVVYPNLDMSAMRKNMVSKSSDPKDVFVRMTMLSSYKMAVLNDYQQVAYR